MLVQNHLFPDEAARNHLFPATKNGIFLGHAAVAPLSRLAAEKIQQMAHAATLESQEPDSIMQEVEAARGTAAKLINAKASEIALIGPTALGLNLVANGLPWNAGDEVVYYPGDYPANVYPWLNLAERGVKPVGLRPEKTGHLTPELVLAAVTPRTKLVALSSCHFLTGYRLDYKTIGSELARRGVLFSIDGIQSLGATELDSAYFDFLSADAHKWLLGPLGTGVVFVKERHFSLLKPTLLGAWNVHSPQYIAQPKIAFHATARRYECGTLNAQGILGMTASIEMLLTLGIDRIQSRLLQLHAYGAGLFREAGFTVLSDTYPEEAKSGILTVQKPASELVPLFAKLTRNRVTASLRRDLEEVPYLRFSPHFYNTEDEWEAVLKIIASA